MRKSQQHTRGRQLLWPLFVPLLLLAGLPACGAGTEVSLRLTVSSRAGRAITPPPADDDGEQISVGVRQWVSQALLRIGSVRIETDGPTIQRQTRVNANLLGVTTLLETNVAASRVDKITLEIPRPDGAGVVRNEPVSVFAAGVFGETPFQYRDAAMEPVEIDAETEMTDEHMVLDLSFDLSRWFEEVDEDLLEPDEYDEYRVDEQDNVETAQEIEEGIRDSVSLRVGASPTCSTCEE
jgi:hypothetical protein